MATVNPGEHVVSKIVEQYLESRRNRDWPISVATAVRAVRAASYCPELSDRQLGSVIVAAAIARGRNVAFDLETASSAAARSSLPAG